MLYVNIILGCRLRGAVSRSRGGTAYGPLIVVKQTRRTRPIHANYGDAVSAHSTLATPISIPGT